jgi:hypothetical protein
VAVDVTGFVPKEKPTPMGWSMYNMLANSFQLNGFNDGVEAPFMK